MNMRSAILNAELAALRAANRKPDGTPVDEWVETQLARMQESQRQFDAIHEKAERSWNRFTGFIFIMLPLITLAVVALLAVSQ